MGLFGHPAQHYAWGVRGVRGRYCLRGRGWYSRCLGLLRPPLRGIWDRGQVLRLCPELAPEKPSAISWGIEERFAYDTATDTWGEEQVRSAKCYVFCLYTEKVREAADVLDLEKWEFYVLSTERINRELGTQKRVGLGRIQRMTGPVRYARLRESVDLALAAGDRA